MSGAGLFCFLRAVYFAGGSRRMNRAGGFLMGYLLAGGFLLFIGVD